MRLNFVQFATLLFVVVMLVGSSARGAAGGTIHIEAGWGGRVKPGCWNPVFVTVSTPKPTNVILRISSPHDSVNSINISLGLTSTSAPTTYPLIVPLTYSLDKTVATLIDARTGKVIDDTPFAPETANLSPYQASAELLATGDKFIGITGRDGSHRMLSAQLTELGIKSDFMPQDRLPTAPAGYDALDALVLSNANFVTLAGDQQQAIADWVRAGGCLIVWPSEDTQPDTGTLVDLLPGTFGDNVSLNASAAQLRNAGLSDRFGKLRARKFNPKAGSTSINLFGQLAGARMRQGFGQVVALSFDAALLQFNSTDDAQKFWKPILSPLMTLPDPANPSYAYTSPEQARRTMALQADMDLIGTIPGVGRFDFKWVALTLSGLILLVGPIDWFILRKLNRQPMTWVTTTGWIVLVTTAAVSAGYLIKSGDLHVRTLRLVDQADAKCVATNDLVCVYSPQTRRYDLSVDRDGWWRPAAPEQMYYANGRSAQSIEFHQDPRGNRVADGELLVNIWNMKFMEGESIKNDPPLVGVSLNRAPKDGTRADFVGAVTNYSANRLSGLVLRMENGFWKCDTTIAPASTGNVRFSFRNEIAAQTDQSVLVRSYGTTTMGDVPAGKTVDLSVANYGSIFDLAVRRSIAIERWMRESTDHAVVYATVDAPPGAARLTGEATKEKHYQVVRSLVTIGQMP